MGSSQRSPLASVARSYLIPRGASTRESAGLHLRANEGERLTGCREHLFASEHCVRSRHKAHHLFGLAQRLSSSGEPDDRLGKDDSSSRDRSEHSWEWHRLCDPVSTTSQSRRQQRPNSRRFFPEASQGSGQERSPGTIPGAPEGCQASVASVLLKGRNKVAVLGQLPDKPNTIGIRLPQTQDSARAHADTRLADRSDGI